MKFKKKTILVLALCWVFGIAGGYYIGVESASIPTESIQYNYYSADYSKSSVKAVEPNADNEDAQSESHFVRFIKSLHLMEIPKKIIQKVVSPSACNTAPCEKTTSSKECESLA